MKLSEIYQSVQGEGPNVGKPTTFVRFGGCNLRCPGWGKGTLPDGTVVSGCDTVYAVYPEWRHTWEDVTPGELVKRIPETPKNICITGGEPLTQRSSEMRTLVEILIDDTTDSEWHHIDLFTNGSRLLPDWALWKPVTVIMDFKLPSSGEYGSFKEDNWDRLEQKDAIKFVCKDYYDFQTAKREIQVFRPRCQIYFGAVWGALAESTLADWVQEVPDAKLNVQIHKFIWPYALRGV